MLVEFSGEDFKNQLFLWVMAVPVSVTPLSNIDLLCLKCDRYHPDVRRAFCGFNIVITFSEPIPSPFWGPSQILTYLHHLWNQSWWNQMLRSSNLIHLLLEKKQALRDRNNKGTFLQNVSCTQIPNINKLPKMVTLALYFNQAFQAGTFSATFKLFFYATWKHSVLNMLCAYRRVSMEHLLHWHLDIQSFMHS